MDIRKITESFYDCVCDIYEYREQTDHETGVTSFREEAVYKGIKCRVSYTTGLFQGSVKVGTSAVDNVTSKQYIKLFLPPDINIKSGCVFEVTKNDSVLRLKNSGRAYMYNSHQEVLIESSEDYN